MYLRVAVNGNSHKQYCRVTLKGCLNRVVKCFDCVELLFEKCLNEGCLLSNWIYIYKNTPMIICTTKDFLSHRHQVEHNKSPRACASAFPWFPVLE